MVLLLVFILVVPIIPATPSSDCVNQLPKIISLLQTEIQNLFPCRLSIDLVLSSALLDSYPLHNLSTQMTDQPQVYIVRDFLLNRTSEIFPSKFRCACFLVLDYVDATSEETFVSEFLVDVRPGRLDRTFYVQILSGTNITEEILGNVSASVSLLQHTLLLTCGGNDTLKVFKGTAVANMTDIGVYTPKNNFSVTRPMFTVLEDFNQGPVFILNCPVCVADEELFAKKHFWDSYTHGVMYYACLRLNATTITEQVFGVPGDGKKEDGSWDDFVAPLIDGSAALSTMIKPNTEEEAVMYFTMPYLYDAVTFITGPPKMRSNAGISLLKDPLNLDVWLAFVVCVTLIFFSLEAVAHLHRMKFAHRRIVIAVLQPIVDQNAFTSKFGRTAEDGLVNILVGLWLMGLIVLSCAYRSELISAIVIPKYDQPPRTFKELVDSEYQINGVFYTNFIEYDLLASNNTMSRMIIDRIYEYDYLDPQCYQGIFEGPRACIGYTIGFDGIGIEYLVDIHGRKMFMAAKDRHYDNFMVIGVSKYYPVLVEPLNQMLSLLEATGVSEFSRRYGLGQLAKKGQDYARKNIHILGYYAGEMALTNDAEDRRTANLLLSVARFGFFAAIVLFFLECLSRQIYLCWRRVSRLSSSQVTLIVPQPPGYINPYAEFGHSIQTYKFMYLD